MPKFLPQFVPKALRYVSALLFCVFALVVAVYAFESRGVASPVWLDDMYARETLKDRQQGLDIRGEKPVILEEYFGMGYEGLNDEIEQAVTSLIEGARRVRARSVKFDFEIYSTNQVVSIVISATARAVTDRTSVLSVNFNPRNGASITLGEAMARRGFSNIELLAESKIADMIRQDPATFYAAFTAPPTGQAFYLTDTSLFLLFDEFQLSSVPGAISHIEFQLSNIQTHTVRSNEYRISEGRYDIKMMPVRSTLESLGFTVDWDPDNSSAVVSLHGSTIILLTAGENNYQLNGVLQRSLEVAPTMYNHHMYVPLSFFDQILPLTAFSVNNQGAITFITYLGR